MGAGMQTYVLVCMQCTGVGSGGGRDQASAAVPDSRVPGLRGSRLIPDSSVLPLPPAFSLTGQATEWTGV